ncbi:MAG TPA: biotin/lipoyl-binding protein, partial [Chlorobaculum parvum]|nr:biotin/lipoyl-binding protein [Chlorobaculum parvum]
MPEQQQSNHEKPAKALNKRPQGQSWPRLAIFGVLIAIGLVWGGLKLIRSLSYEETDDAQIAGNIYPVIPRVPGKVVEVLTDDNKIVNKGDVLIKLDPSDYQVKRDMAEAQLLKAQAAVSAAKADIVAAAATKQKLNADLHRSRNLQKQDVISRAELDAVTAGATASTAQHAAAEDQYKAALAQKKLAEA